MKRYDIEHFLSFSSPSVCPTRSAIWH